MSSEITRDISVLEFREERIDEVIFTLLKYE